MKLQTTAESMQTGSHRAAIMLKTVCVVISNYSKLQNIENTSQDFIHCKMQGALNGKTMHVVCPLFTQIVYTAVQPLWNYCGRKFSEIRATHEMVFWHSGFTKFNFGRGSAPVPLGELTTLLQTL